MTSLQDNQIDKTKGLKWYKIFLVISFIRIFGTLAFGISNVTDSAASIQMDTGLFIKMFPYFSFSSFILGIVGCILSVILFGKLLKYNKQCVLIIKYIIVFTILSFLITVGAWYIDFAHMLDAEVNNSYYQSCFSAAIANLILLVPTYYYLRKRFI